MRRGFTIVEMLVVVAIVAILALLVVVMYTSVQEQANDTKIQDAAVKVGDGLSLFYTKYGHFPAGGSGSSVALGAGTECSNGSGGFVAKDIYTCTIEETLITNGYLSASVISGLPANTRYSPTSANYAIYVRTAGVTAGKIMVMYSMEHPIDIDDNHFEAQLAACGLAWWNINTEYNTYGMRNGECIAP